MVIWNQLTKAKVVRGKKKRKVSASLLWGCVLKKAVTFKVFPTRPKRIKSAQRKPVLSIRIDDFHLGEFDLDAFNRKPYYNCDWGHYRYEEEYVYEVDEEKVDEDKNRD